jgi:hypothetical protein
MPGCAGLTCEHETNDRRSMPLVTSSARRGCGYRPPGGASFAVPLAPGGSPVEEFLIHPPS